jgi:hypothetical protein
MGEEVSTSGRQKALREATIPLDLATPARAQQPPRWRNSAAGPGMPESGQARAWQLTKPYGAANGDAHKEVTTMWSKLFGGGGGLPREKVDAVVHVIDRYLAEEAELRRLQSEKQTIHLRDLPLDKRRALIEEVFAILASTSKK